jgi:hypothetical protein
LSGHRGDIRHPPFCKIDQHAQSLIAVEAIEQNLSASPGGHIPLLGCVSGVLRGHEVHVDQSAGARPEKLPHLRVGAGQGISDGPFVGCERVQRERLLGLNPRCCDQQPGDNSQSIVEGEFAHDVLLSLQWTGATCCKQKPAERSTSALLPQPVSRLAPPGILAASKLTPGFTASESAASLQRLSASQRYGRYGLSKRPVLRQRGPFLRH